MTTPTISSPAASERPVSPLRRRALRSRLLRSLGVCACVGTLAAIGPRASAEDAPGGSPADPARLEVRWFAVGDLTAGTQQFRPDKGPAPVACDQVNDEENPMFGGEGEETIKMFGGTSEIVELLKATAGPPFAWEMEGTSIAEHGDRAIVVRQTRAVLEGCEAALADLRRRANVGLVVDVAVVAADPVQFADGDVAAALARGVTPLAAARVCGRPLERIVGRTGGQQAYVQDYDVEVAQESKIGDPIVGVLHDGLAFDATAYGVRPGRVRLNVHAWWSETAAWHTSEPTETGLTMLPETRAATAGGVLDVKPGVWTVLRASGVATDGRVFLVRVGVLDAPPSVPSTFPPPPAPGGPTGALRTAMLDVSDLAEHVVNRRGTEMRVSPSNYTPPEPPEVREPATVFPTDALLEFTKLTTGPEAWFADGTSLEVRGGTVLVRNDDTRIAVVEKLLDAARARFLRGTRVRELLVRLPLASLPEWWSGLDDALVADGGSALVARPGASALDRAALRLLDGQRDAASNLRHQAYVADFDVEIAQKSAIGNPIIRNLVTGTDFDVDAIGAGGDAVLCVLRATRAELVELQKTPTPVGDIEVPTIRLQKQRGSALFRPGVTRIVGAAVDGATVTLTLVTMTPD